MYFRVLLHDKRSDQDHRLTVTTNIALFLQRQQLVSLRFCAFATSSNNFGLLLFIIMYYVIVDIS